MFNPLAFITGLGWQVKALALIALAVICFGSGWTVHRWKVDASANNQVNKDLKAADGIAKEGDVIIGAKQEAEQKERVVYRTIYKEINDANNNNICFTSDSLQLWNKSIAGADPVRAKPVTEAGEDDTATVKEVLTNAAENFEICRDNSIKHNALIDKAESLQGKMCVCGS